MDGPMLGILGARQRLVDDNYGSTTRLIPDRRPLNADDAACPHQR
jgi:hypothetical protein